MKALVCNKYGPPDVLEYREVEKPVAGPGEVLVKVLAVAPNMADVHLLTADIFLVRLSEGLFKPNRSILGTDIAGRVEAVGAGVTQFKPGDEVFGSVSRSGWGGFAEYVRAREDMLVKKPANLSFEEAAAAPMAANTALQALRDIGKIQPGQKVLINGASGGVGHFAVQLARYFGAEVTAVCSSGKMEMVRELGADIVIDYSKEDFTKNGKQYDLILAANGYHPLRDYQRALKPGGIYVMAGGKPAQMFEVMLMGSMMSSDGRKMVSILEEPNQKDLALLGDLLETGKIKVVIDRTYPMKEGAEAMRYLGRGHTMGKVVMKVGES
jgi:NADPH:quinone reductase-like Zn-dependent oxidoreductase